jgi:hypothetical protein
MQRQKSIKDIWLEVSNIALNEVEEADAEANLEARVTATVVAVLSTRGSGQSAPAGNEEENARENEGDVVKGDVAKKDEAKTKVPRSVCIDVQLKGDWEDDRWLIFKAGVEKFKPLMEAMKEKRPIHAKLAVKDGKLRVTELRVSFAASARI